MTAASMKNAWATKIEKELKENILAFWMRHAIDEENGGFLETIRSDLTIPPDKEKSLVLHARMLWTFAAAYRLYPEKPYRLTAERAYRCLTDRFSDKEHGGFYWKLDADGQPIEDRKRVSAQANVIYALSEWARASGQAEALGLAVELFRLLERNAYDAQHKAYAEALARDWSIVGNEGSPGNQQPEIQWLSTYLHLLESYTSLYRVWPMKELHEKLKELVDVMLDHIVDEHSSHFRLRFAEGWRPGADSVSYGRDMEGSWLLCKAASALGDAPLANRARRAALRTAEAVLEQGVDIDGGIWNEAAASGKLIDTNKDGWPQAEAVVGFYNAYQLSGDERFLSASQRSWSFIERYIVDDVNGEWHWGVTESGSPLPDRPKGCERKSPYHNSRACYEMLELLGALKTASKQ